MHILEIILDGFKSYAKRTVITGFDPEFNAITGLNGSGKSNVLDSICSEIPMRHDPAPRWKGNTLDVEAACEDLVAYHDTAIVDAWMALGTHENPRNAICRDVARACGGTEEL